MFKITAGPYETDGKKLSFKGDKIFPKIEEIRDKRAPDLGARFSEISEKAEKCRCLMKLYNGMFEATKIFMDKNGAILFDLPITTRMISSPGALSGTIPSDVDPFKIDFFGKETFLTQSSQLYLEFAITVPDIEKVFCWDKSFRRERADFRHLPEFTHIEFEGNINFEENIEFQEKYFKFLIEYLLENYREELSFFITEEDISNLEKLSKSKTFKRITFHKAFEMLYKKTKNEKYKKPCIQNFGAIEEVLITQILGNVPVFVTNYISDEVAFYHANCKDNPTLVKNADFLYPGYGELIGSGERISDKESLKKKAEHFELNMEDYQPYIDSRDANSKTHSGWGMGVERFLQSILKLPFIWDAKIFPRVDNQNRP